ncbi:unnamed protein product [Closterium sp. NIES-53]
MGAATPKPPTGGPAGPGPPLTSPPPDTVGGPPVIALGSSPTPMPPPPPPLLAPFLPFLPPLLLDCPAVVVAAAVLSDASEAREAVKVGSCGTLHPWNSGGGTAPETEATHILLNAIIPLFSF